MIDTSGPAVITGASSGLGAEIARLLYRQHHLILVGRTRDALDSLASELGHDRVTIVAGDIADEETVDRVVETFTEHGAPVLLVNAAGQGDFGPVTDADPARIRTANAVNVDGFTAVTRRIASEMASAKRGVICTIASVAAFFPGPLMAAYYAAKAYQLSFAVALDRELAGTGVRSIAVCPGPFRSAFHARAGLNGERMYQSSRIPTASRIARATVAAIARRRTITVPGFGLRAAVALQTVLPRSVVARLVYRLQSARDSGA